MILDFTKTFNKRLYMIWYRYRIVIEKNNYNSDLLLVVLNKNDLKFIYISYF